MYYVKYEVEGFPGEYQTGPYSIEEALVQEKDIAGFEGVKNTQIVLVEETSK